MKKITSIATSAAMALTMFAATSPPAAQAASPIGIERFKDPDHTARPMARMWFPDATAGQDPNDTIETQIRSLAEAGFGGVEVAMLSDTGVYDNNEVAIAGWGTPNWVKLLKKIYKAAAKVDGGFVIDLTISGHWPPNINTIDPNDPTASKETSLSFTPVTPDALSAGTLDLALPVTKTVDQNKAPFLVTDDLVTAALAKVTKITAHPASGRNPAYDTYEVDYDTMVTLDATQGGGTPAGIPDKAFFNANKASYGWTDSYTSAVVDAFGADGTGPEKIDAKGNRKRLADTQYTWTAALADLDQEVSDAINADLDAVIAEGDWVALGVYYRGTAQNFSGGKAMLMKNRPYVPDYFATAGIKTVTDFWDQHIFSDSELSTLIAANPGSIFEDSIEAQVTTNFWTPRLLEQLGKSYPYAATLPLVVSGVRVAGGFGSSPSPDVLDFHSSDPELVDRIYEDYNALMGQLYLDEHVEPANKWAASHGLSYRAQTYDLAGMDIGAAASKVTIPEGDNMTKGDGLRRLSGANNLNDKKYLSMEAITGTVVNRFNWEEVLFELTSNYSWGVNRAILHGTPYSKALNGGVFTGGFGGGHNSADWPGWDPFGVGSFGESYTYRQVYWDAERQVTDYLSRIQGLMQYSTQKIDVAVLQDYHLAFDNPSKNAYQGLLDKGYSYNLLTDGMLANSPNAAKISKKMIYPAGPGYQAVVLDTVKTLSVGTVNLLSAYADAGIPIIMLDTDPGSVRVYGTDQGQDAKLQARFTRLANKRSVKVAHSKSEIAGLLAASGVEGRARYSVPKLETTAYADGDTNWYYLYNDTSTFQGMLGAGLAKAYKDPSATNFAAPIKNPTVVLEGSGTPYLLDAHTGEVRQAGEYTDNGDGTVSVRLDTLPGGAATIVALSNQPLAATGPTVATVVSDGDYSITRNATGTPVLRAFASGDYAVTLADGTSTTVSVTVPTVDALDDWTLKLDSYGPKYANASELLNKTGIQLVDPSATRITSVDLGAVELGAWKDIPVASGVLADLGVDNMDQVSGRGYYHTTFDWTSPNASALLRLGYGNDQITGVTINGVRLAVSNLVDAIDLGEHLRVGSNDLTVELSTTLNHRASAVKGGNAYTGGIGGAVPSKYLVNGLSAAELVPYAKASIEKTVVKAPAKVTVKVSGTKVKRGKTVKFAVKVAAAGSLGSAVVPTGKVSVKVAGKSATAWLDASGTATLKVKVPKKTKVGSKTWTVRYLGDDQVSAKKISGKIKVTH